MASPSQQVAKMKRFVCGMYVVTGKEKVKFEGHTAQVNSVSFSPDGWSHPRISLE